jgi:teichuronic acid biosynthesis glycosyltransferase TuaG
MTDLAEYRDDLVSIITPAFRAAAYIDATIQSVIDQTYPHWEMLIADDCSPDNTREIVAAWADREPRIKLIKLEKNGGPAAARNAALEQASGRWLAFLDSDDVWLPEKLDTQLKFHKSADTAITFTGLRSINADGSVTGNYVPPPEWLDYDRALGLTGIACSTVILDRGRTGRVRMKSVYYDDYACWLEVLSKGGRGYGLNMDLMRYRVLAGSVSRDKLRSAKEVWRQIRTTENQPLHRAIPAFLTYAVNGVIKYSRR